MMEVCLYFEEIFKIFGRSWNGLIINYFLRCNDCLVYFFDMKRDLKIIILCVLSFKLLEFV